MNFAEVLLKAMSGAWAAVEGTPKSRAGHRSKQSNLSVLGRGEQPLHASRSSPSQVGVSLYERRVKKRKMKGHCQVRQLPP